MPIAPQQPSPKERNSLLWLTQALRAIPIYENYKLALVAPSAGFMGNPMGSKNNYTSIGNKILKTFFVYSVSLLYLCPRK
ncbi:MAG: hypothetical protein D8H93_11810 [Capnocytophaga sp.]|nr:MAG: hypothetical protein D8H93_11810 [Capnocytophaga sp.]